jgi:hypothetical protein
MRETCVRVLAGALMTGAIATVVAMSALLGAPGEAGPPLAAPPSSLQRSVPVVALPRPEQGPRLQPRMASRPVAARPRPVVLARSLVVIRRHRSAEPPRRLATAKPKPTSTPAPRPSPAQAPALAPTPAQPVQQAQLAPATVTPAPAAPAAAAPVQPDENQQHGNGHGNGHAYGHDKHDD